LNLLEATWVKSVRIIYSRTRNLGILLWLSDRALLLLGPRDRWSSLVARFEDQVKPQFVITDYFWAGGVVMPPLLFRWRKSPSASNSI
jgi:hypothetical protein